MQKNYIVHPITGAVSKKTADYLIDPVTGAAAEIKKPHKTTVFARYWVNQPSKLQPDHRFHGLNVLAPANLKENSRATKDGRRIVVVYFVADSIEGADMFTNSLSKGWKE